MRRKKEEIEAARARTIRFCSLIRHATPADFEALCEFLSARIEAHLRKGKEKTL